VQQPRIDNVPLGMLAASGAFFMFMLMNVFAKFLSADHSVIEIAFYRNLVACVPFFFIMFVFGRGEVLIIQSRPKIITLRAFLGSISLVATFGAYSLMPMAETAVLLFTASLFAPILGVIFLHEKVGPFRWSAVLIGFVGILIMLGPSGTMNILGVTLAMTAALLQGFLTILLRHLGGHERPETVSLYFFLIGTLITGMAMPFVATRPAVEEIPLIFGVGFSGAAAQWLYSVALKNAPAAIVAVFNYSSIVWATLFGWLIWKDWPLPMVFAGSAVVIASNLLIVWRESKVHRATRHRG
jgi:drug/metabolite transporter (DMT)-like permease